MSTMTTRRTVIIQGIGWLIVLAPFFFLTYGMANQFTAGRENICSLVFSWEQRISFIPLTIIPYWSLDLLYGLSLLICTSLNEQRRLVLAYLIACAGFLLFPLRFTFIRPEMTGLASWLFGQLEQFELPYNQSPSPPIILCWLLWRHFHHHLSGVWGKLSVGWFLVIAASVLTTWQHHVIDVITGLAVGLVIDWLIPQTGTWHWRIATGKRRKLAGYYCCGALVCLAGTFLSTWFWWPVLTLTLVALAFGAAGVDALQKDDQGRLSPATWLLLLPWRSGIWLSMRLYTRPLLAVSPLMEGVSLGAYPQVRPEQCAVLDLTSEFPRSSVVDNVAYRCVPMLDLVNPDDAALHQAVSELEYLRTTQGDVLLHCALGLSRSALVAAAWLIQRDPDLTVAQAIARVRAAHPAVVFTAEHIELLNKWKTKLAA